MIAAASCCATTNAQRPRSAQAPQLAVGDDYFVHAVPLKPGCVVVHTVKSSGVMKPLLKIAPPEGALRASARGGVEVFPAGAARDGERLYVVAAERSPRATAATLKLHAFWLADGRPLVGDGVDAGTATEPQDTLGAGALKLIEGGVECNGTALLFDGRRLQKIEANGRSFTPPPDLYETQEHGRIY
jgi:hypothetical protein